MVWVQHLGPNQDPPRDGFPTIVVHRKRDCRPGAYAAETRDNNLAGADSVCIVAAHGPGGLEDAIARASNYAANDRLRVIYVRDELSEN